jgi:Glycosyl transferase family 2
MSQSVLSHLLCNVADLHEDTRLQVLDAVRAGQAAQALECLCAPTVVVDRTSKAWGALQLYLLHLKGEYAQANRVLDDMIGMKLSEQLAIENCPTEADLMAHWDSAAEGVSILCTTFNHARFIGMALASFFSQVSTHPFEVIVRDDASTDGTIDILRDWEKRYPVLLKVIRLTENTYQKGQSPMLATMPHATYPLMAMCEGDDFWIDSNKLQQQAQLLQKNPTWSAVTHNHFELEESTGRLTPGRTTKIRGVLPRQDLVNVNLVLWGHTLMVRRSLLKMPVYQLQDGVLGDQVMTSMLGVAGEVFFIGDLFGSVARRNLFSTYTPLNAADKQSRRINTRRFLSPILEQRGEKQAAQRMLRWCQLAEQQMSPLAA